MGQLPLRVRQLPAEGDPPSVLAHHLKLFTPSGIPAARLTANASSLGRETLLSPEPFGHGLRPNGQAAPTGLDSPVRITVLLIRASLTGLC